jgi:cell wall-associated NlpC family hydrolase
MNGQDAQTRMMERLLSDPDFRARFRRTPAAVAREEGAADLAAELSVIGDPMQTLDFRESRSSVAGVMMALAVEGLGIYELGRQILPHVEDAQAATATPSSGGTDHLDPGQFGQPGTGGKPSEEALALLANRNVHFDASGLADLNAGRIDPRVVSVLGTISEKHSITVSATPDGRGVDISSVDGHPVSAQNKDAVRLARELSQLDPSIRPSRVSSNGDRLHAAFDEPIDPDWSPPAASLAPAGAVSSPAAVDLPAVPAAPPSNGANGAAIPLSPDDTADDGGDDEDEDEPDEDSAEHDAWDETHESGSDEDSGGSGDDGSSESGSDEDSGPSTDSGFSDSGDSGDSGGDAAPGVPSLPDDGLQVPGGSGDYPGDDARAEEVAAWMASEAQKRGLPPELPVMAGLVESGLKNLPGGDADSVGFFQMRVSIWNKGDYSGYAKKPELQLRWFLDHAEAVKKQRVARGLSAKDSRQYGEWIADVERPAAQYRGRYQLQLDDARALLKKAGAKSGGGGVDELIDGHPNLGAGRRAQLALTEARKYLGTPYRWGGSSPKTGFDCSGLVQWAYAKAGIRIPRVTDQQILAANGTKVGRNKLLTGDLVFFKDPSGYVHHVGISLGGNRFLHAPHTGDVVKISSLKESYYAQQFAGGRRFDHAVSSGRDVQVAGVSASGGSARVAGGFDRGAQAQAEAQAAQLARAALERDAAEVARSNSLLFMALSQQEQSWDSSLNQVRFMAAVGREPSR